MDLANPSLFRQQCYIAGQWIDADSKDTFPVYNPYDGSQIGTVPRCGIAETRRAIEAANKAWPEWRSKSVKERHQLLLNWSNLIDQHHEDLAKIMTLEQGKPITESRGEITYANNYIRWFAAEALRIYGDVIGAPNAGDHMVVIKQPIGVTAAITPWNFPAAMITRKCGPALAAGCPMIIKPAEDTPYSALALMVLAEEAGIPPGVISVVTGIPQDIGKEMCENPLVRKLSFTGSTPVGKTLMKQCADTVKKVSMELGGNAPFIVFDDADIDQAIAGVLRSKFRNMGQTCVCANRILVQDSIYDEFSKKLANAVTSFKLGNGLKEDVTQGPLINAKAIEKVSQLVDDAMSKGAKALTGGKAANSIGKLFFEPTVLCGANTEMAFTQEEIFGPVAPLFPFKTEAQAVEMANNTIFGLASYFFSRNIGRVWRVGEALEYGMVGINSGMVSSEMAPFGGVKQSGIGREGSKYGIEEYVEIKNLYMGRVD